jgi:hypothetical protein
MMAAKAATSFMWRITLILNALLMAVFSYGSAASQIKLHNQYVQYPHVGGQMPDLPAISSLALRLQWLLKTVPILWALLTLALLIWKWRQPEPPRDWVQLHTSATLLIGVFMLGFFVVAGVMPYISIVVRMR